MPSSASVVLRNTLESLGDSEAAGRAVALRWPDRLDEGHYRYMVAAHEVWTCKNGKTSAVFHYGEVREPATRWPDTLREEIRSLLEQPWKLGRAASKCKGEADIETVIVDEPLEPGADLDDWLDQERQTFAEKAAEARKTSEVEEPPLTL